MSAVERMSKFADSAKEIQSIRENYKLFKDRCREDGWSNRDITEMDECIRLDFADGPGMEREFQMTKAERIQCWKEWLVGRLNIPAGVNERIRQSIEEKKRKAA